MKTLEIILCVSLSLELTGCMHETANSNSNKSANSQNTSRQVNTSSNSVSTSNSVPTPVPSSSANSMSNTSSSKMANATADSQSKNPAANMAMSNANLTVQNKPPAVTETKKDNLFSFPPPKDVDTTEIDNRLLIGNDAAPTFSTVSQKLTDFLKRGGYSKDEFSYFWNNDNEFAVVTRMERINPDGTVFDDDKSSGRWSISDELPPAHNFHEYIFDLFKGRVVYYRVFAFIVTGKDYNFSDGVPPSFAMAKNWKNQGTRKLGGMTSPATIREVPFNDQYHCYALLYLFINHTSLDTPMAINDPQVEESLSSMVEQRAEEHLVNTKILERANQ